MLLGTVTRPSFALLVFSPLQVQIKVSVAVRVLAPTWTVLTAAFASRSLRLQLMRNSSSSGK